MEPRAEGLGQRAWEHLRALAEGIGARPATSEAEAQAQEYGRAVLEPLGARVAVEEFRSARTFTWPWLASSLFFLVSGSLAWLGFSHPAHLLSALLAVLGGGVYLSLVRGGWKVLRLFPQGRSRNLIGILPARVSPRRQVVLIAHVDSTRACLIWHPRLVRTLGASFRFQTLMIGALILATLLILLMPSLQVLMRWLTLPGLIASGWGIFVLLHRELCMPWVQGANDNGSGIALALAIMETLARQPLDHTKVWCVLTGCEEVGAPVGAAHFLFQHGEQLRDAYLLILDTLGIGEPRYLLSEGMFPRRNTPPEMVTLAQQVARHHPEWNLKPSRVPPPAYTDALPFLAAGFRALALWSEREGVLPNWHWHTDTLERIEPEALQRAGEMVLAFLQRIEENSQSEVQ